MNEQARKRLGITQYDVAENLRDEDDVRLYLQACLDEGGTDAPYIAHALGTVARSQGMAAIAARTGLSRESLYKSLSGDRTPSFDTVLKVLDALGLGLGIKSKGRQTPALQATRALTVSHIRSLAVASAGLLDDVFSAPRDHTLLKTGGVQGKLAGPLMVSTGISEPSPVFNTSCHFVTLPDLAITTFGSSRDWAVPVYFQIQNPASYPMSLRTFTETISSSQKVSPSPRAARRFTGALTAATA
jgi:probable addiction module antidote protein